MNSKDNHPLLSIITVNLNNHNGLIRTIDSVVSQTFTNYEWIVIDGGSTDGSRELIEQYQDHFSYWCCEPDKGIYNAMNKGIALAKGKWLQFLNSGDFLHDSETLKNVFQTEYTSDILYGNAMVEINNQYVLRRYPKEISLSYLAYHPINHQASFYQRTLYNNRLFDENYIIISDYIFLIESVLLGKTFEYIDEIIAHTEGNGRSSLIGRDNFQRESPLIPLTIQRDVDYIENIRRQNFKIESHRILKAFNKIQTKAFNLLSNTISYIEKKRKKKK